MATMPEINRLAQAYSEEWNQLQDLANAINAEINEVRKRHQDTVDRIMKRHENAYGDLLAAIESNPELFDDPKSVELFGVKVGYQKSADRLEIDEVRTVMLIKKYFPEQAQLLLKTVEKPVLTTLKKLNPADMRKIGCKLIPGEDQAFVRPMNKGDVDKILNNILA